MTYQEHENVTTRLQRLMMAQQQLDTEIHITGTVSRRSPTRSPSPLLYPRPHSPQQQRPPAEEPYVSQYSPVELEVNDEWLQRMQDNRLGLTDPDRSSNPGTPERLTDALHSPDRHGSSPTRLVSPRMYYSPTPSSYLSEYGGANAELDSEMVAEALSRKLSPTMRERIRRALQRSLGQNAWESTADGEPLLSPTTQERLGNAYQMAQGISTGGRYSQQLLYDALYNRSVEPMDKAGVDSTQVEFAEFRSWLDRIFDEPTKKKVTRAASREMVSRVRTV
eukprot:TRINITY_DN12759_c0_g1_i1.p1 TRINITY_DN12759_c0_g1~~TRINITY_DN12759_c0_g1_i1.p1  ORF type:complete len:279 (-),score=58.52 TRINITY_DN12759_c0_g1_i1:809-1645(-)